MKKNYLSMLFAMFVLLFATGTQLFAGNVMSIGNVSGQPGETVEMTINLANDDPVCAFQVDITLPEQVTFNGTYALTSRASASHQIVANIVSSGALRILVYSMPAVEFSGNNGAICTFEVVLSDAPGNYSVTLSDAVLSGATGNPFDVTTQNGIITIEGGTADNLMYINNYTGNTGDQLTVEVNLANSEDISGFQFDIPLNGFAYVDGSIAKAARCTSNHIILAQLVNNGATLRVLCYSMPGANLIGNDGPIASFDILLGSVAGNFPLALEGAVISTIQGATPAVSTQNGSLTIIGGTVDNNYLIVEDVTAYAGETATFTIDMTNVDEVVGFQFDVILPEGFEYVEGSAALTSRATPNHYIAANMLNGALRILTYSMPGTAFTGNSGAVVTFDAVFGAPAGAYTVAINDAILSDFAGNSLPVETVDGIATVLPSVGNYYTINASAAPQGAGSVSGTGTYPEGTTATLIATPNAGYAFSNWTEDGLIVSTTSSYSFTVTCDRTLVANFSEVSGNVMTLSTVYGESGSVATFSISVDNEIEFVGFQTDVIFPDEVEFVEGSVMLTNRASVNHYLIAQMVSDHTLRILSYSMPGTAFTGNSGAVCTFNVILNGEDGTYPVLLDQSYISDIQGYTPPLTAIDGAAVIGGASTIYTITATANPAEAGSVSGTGDYVQGETATLIATSNAGWIFQSWTENGTVVSTNSIYSFTVNSNRTLVANFTELTGNVMTLVSATALINTTVTMSVTLDNIDEIVGYQADITFPSGVTFIPGSVALTDRASSFHILYAQEIQPGVLRVLCYSMPGTPFAGNSGPIFTFQVQAGSITGDYPLILSDAVISMNSGFTPEVTAVSGILSVYTNATEYNITASVSPANSGTVIGVGTYSEGQTATLTANANFHYTFLNWTENGSVVSTSSVYSFVVTRDRNLVANFEATPQFTINATPNPLEGGTVNGAGTYYYGDLITLNAHANTGYEFVNWTESGAEVSATPTFRMFVTRNRSLKANFTKKEVVLNVYANPLNGGNVTGGGIYHYDDVVTISATANAGYTFTAWYDGNTIFSHDATVQFEIETNLTLIAEFEINTYTISATASPSNYGTVIGAGVYEYGYTVTLLAIPNDGYKFVNWTEGNTVVSPYSDLSFVVTDNRTFVAHFAELTGLEDVTVEDITVYPNPATTSCIIECPALMGKLIVVNEKGMIVRSVEDVNATSYELDMDGFAKGTYFIQIIAPQGNIVKKVVKM